MEKEFKRIRSSKDIILSTSSMVAGALLLILPTAASINVAGFLLIFVGIILLFILKTKYKLIETGEIFRKKEKFFARKQKASIAKLLANDPENIDFEKEGSGDGLRIDTYYNRKTGKVYCRLCEYVPYKYEACTPYFEYSTESASKLIE